MKCISCNENSLNKFKVIDTRATANIKIFANLLVFLLVIGIFFMPWLQVTFIENNILENTKTETRVLVSATTLQSFNNQFDGKIDYGNYEKYMSLFPIALYIIPVLAVLALICNVFFRRKKFLSNFTMILNLAWLHFMLWAVTSVLGYCIGNRTCNMNVLPFIFAYLAVIVAILSNFIKIDSVSYYTKKFLNKRNKTQDVAIPTKRSNKKLSRNIFILLAIAWPIVHWLVFTVYMNLKTIEYAFQSWNYRFGEIKFFGYVNFNKYIFDLFENNLSVREGFINSIIWIPFNCVIILGISIVIAYVLSKKVPFSNFFRALFFYPSIITTVVLVIAWQFMFAPNGAVNAFLTSIGFDKFINFPWLGQTSTALTTIFLYCLWAGIGFNVTMLMGAMVQVSEEYYEAGRIDGISKFKEFIYITFPNIWPNVYTLIILNITSAFTVYLQPKLMTEGNYGTKTIQMINLDFITKDGLYAYASAGGILISIVLGIIIFGAKHYMDKLDKKWHG